MPCELCGCDCSTEFGDPICLGWYGDEADTEVVRLQNEESEDDEMSKFKPYNLVHVHHECYVHVGQVISRPTGEGTIMVRMVPDDSSTMEEVPLDKLTGVTSKYKWVHYAEVDGFGSFPVDMLRYDHAAPVNFTIEMDEQGRVETTLKKGQTKLIVAKASEKKYGLSMRPTWMSDRWQSYLWNIHSMGKPLKIENI